MGQFSVEKPELPGSVLSGNQHDQLATFVFARPFALNGIGEFVHRPDLMDRALPLHLEAMPDGARRTEAEIWREFDELLPELLHDLYTAVAHALANVATTPVPTSIRMADAAHWLVAAEGAVGFAPGTFVQAITDAQQGTQADLAMQELAIPGTRARATRGAVRGPAG